MTTTQRDLHSQSDGLVSPQPTSARFGLPGMKSRPYRAALLLGLGWVVFTGAWLGLNLGVPGLQGTGIPSTVVRVILQITMLVGLWLGLSRTDFGTRTRVMVWLAIAIPFTAWLIVVWWLAVDGAFRPTPGGVPALPIAIFLPVLLGLPLLLRSARVAAVLDRMPTWWLPGVQAYRIFGGIFLVGWSRGEISGTFALPAGVGDVLVGVLAVPVAYLLFAGVPSSGRLAVAWNVLGLLDFAVAIGVGMLSAPGPQQLIVPDVPNGQLGSFPTVMIPAFAVPSSIILHGLSLWQLRRAGRSSTDAPAPLASSPVGGVR